MGKSSSLDVKGAPVSQWKRLKSIAAVAWKDLADVGATEEAAVDKDLRRSLHGRRGRHRAAAHEVITTPVITPGGESNGWGGTGPPSVRSSMKNILVKNINEED